MLFIAAHARLGKDPVTRETRTGKEMATTTAAVDVIQGENDQQTLWLGLVAFGRMADTLMRPKQGDPAQYPGEGHTVNLDGPGRPGAESTVCECRKYHQCASSAAQWPKKRAPKLSQTDKYLFDDPLQNIGN